MNSTNLNSSEFDLSEKEIQKKAREAYDKGDYLNAYNLYLSIYKQSNNPRGLQISIGLCLLKMNKKRQARLFAFKEILDYPDNEIASRLLDEQSLKVSGRTIIRKFDNPVRPEKYPDISLVLIVKNEEKDLPRCLESFKDIVKEIIVVDTGSTDRTVEIAKSFGARVEYYEWTNDFSAARNESLKYASCEWILRTDADEWIEDSEKGKLLNCVNSGVAEIYLCPTISKIKQGVQKVENVRLIKNHLGICYNYPIHETVAICANKLGLTQCLTNVEFLHSGYEFLDEGSGEKKTDRNIKVCSQYLELHPDDFYVRLIRGLLMLNTTRKVEAINDLEIGTRNIPDDASPVKYLGLAYIALAEHYMQNKRDVDLLNILLDAQIDFNIYSCMMQFVGDVYLHNRGDWKKAYKLLTFTVRHYSTKLTFSDILFAGRFNEEECTLLLAESCVLLKDYESARKYYLQAKKIKKSKKEIAEQTTKSDEFNEDVDSFSAEQLRIFAKAPREHTQWIETYKNIVRAASKSQLTIQDHLDLANCQIQVDNLKLAQNLIDEARLLDPELPLASNLESLMALKVKDIEQALIKAVEAFIKEPGNSSFQNNVEQISELFHLTPVQGIRKVGLGWLENGRIKDGLFALMMYLKFEPEDAEIGSIITKYLN